MKNHTIIHQDSVSCMVSGCTLFHCTIPMRCQRVISEVRRGAALCCRNLLASFHPGASWQGHLLSWMSPGTSVTRSQLSIVAAWHAAAAESGGVKGGGVKAGCITEGATDVQKGGTTARGLHLLLQAQATGNHADAA